jgi:hypothetical protein
LSCPEVRLASYFRLLRILRVGSEVAASDGGPGHAGQEPPWRSLLKRYFVFLTRNESGSDLFSAPSIACTESE